MTLNRYCLFDPAEIRQLLPLAHTRPVAAFRVGILTIQEKWNQHLGSSCCMHTRYYLTKSIDHLPPDAQIVTYINGSILPTVELTEQVNGLEEGQRLVHRGRLVAFRTPYLHGGLELLYGSAEELDAVVYQGELKAIDRNWDLFIHNGFEIESDIERLGLEANVNQAGLALSVQSEGAIYIDSSAKIGACILNASKGPIHIGPEAQIMDGAILMGPVSIGAHSVVKAGAKIYGNTTLGPFCKVGGEVGSSILFGYSNKGHDGYLGNSILGHWCNLGADTNTSNLKNNYSLIKCWDYVSDSYINSGQQFLGVIMGDHSKTGINTMLNTGTIVGVAANLFGSDFPPKFVPSFSWGGSHGMQEHRLDKALETAERVMERRDVKCTVEDKLILEHIFESTSKYRTE